MNRRAFFILALITVAAVALSLMIGQNDDSGHQSDQKFLPGLERAVNDVEGLVQRTSTGVVATLSRGDENWSVSELDHYPADWPKVRAALTALANANIMELKTSNPAYFDRLGLLDPNSPDSGSTEIVIASERQTWNVIAGDVPAKQFGQYVRESGNNQALLIDQELDLPDEAIGWVDRNVLDIGAALVAGLEIRHADGELVRISKVSADDSQFSLETLPEGRELQSAYTLNSAVGILSMLELTDVRQDVFAAADDDQARLLVEAGLVTYSGLKVNVEVIELEIAGLDQGSDDSGANRWLRVTAELANPESDNEEARQMVNEIQQRTAGWVYRIPSTRMDTLTRRNEDFLKPLDDQ